MLARAAALAAALQSTQNLPEHLPWDGRLRPYEGQCSGRGSPPWRAELDQLLLAGVSDQSLMNRVGRQADRHPRRHRRIRDGAQLPVSGQISERFLRELAEVADRPIE
jgi:hypothetical protein